MENIDELFLVYANTPLRGKPENLKKVLESVWEVSDYLLHVSNSQIYQCDPELLKTNTVYSCLASFIDHIIEIADSGIEKACIRRCSSRLHDPDKKRVLDMSRELRLEEGRKSWSPLSHPGMPNSSMMERDHDAAFEAVHGYLHGYCINDTHESHCCDMTGLNCHTLVDPDLYKGPDRLKCYECYQLAFVGILDRIIAGDTLTTIPGLQKLVNIVDDWFSTTRILTDEGYAEYQDVKAPLPWDGESSHIVVDEAFPDKHIVNTFLLALVAESLIAYLNEQKKGRVKLKKCEVCDRYFAAAKAVKTQKRCPVCSQDKGDRRDYHKEYQRKRRKNKRIEKTAKDMLANEKLIRRLMNVSDLSREEALATIADDAEA